MRDKFTVALIQMSCGPEPADNLAKALDRVSDAARKGADVVCLPELKLQPLRLKPHSKQWQVSQR